MITAESALVLEFINLLWAMYLFEYCVQPFHTYVGDVWRVSKLGNDVVKDLFGSWDFTLIQPQVKW